MKLLDRYILSKFLSNFLSSFAILMVIFIFQTIWLYIGDLAGKGLDLVIIGKFIFYFLPSLVDKVLPLTVVLSSILTFGTLAENYEFAAMKASGISLQRAMRTLIVFVLFLGLVVFFFANNVAPAAAFKVYNLRQNIGRVKPAAVIAEGVFSDFEGMNIKVDKKFGENDRFLEKVIIHQKEYGSISNVVIKAKTGELISDKDSPIVQLVLKDGHYYKDIRSSKKKHPFAKAYFDEYTINIALSNLGDQDLEEDRNVDTDKMKNVSRLTKDIDSIKKDNLKTIKAFAKNISLRAGAFKPEINLKKTVPAAVEKVKRTNNEQQTELAVVPEATKDSVVLVQNIFEYYNEQEREQILSSAHSATTNVLNSINARKKEIEVKYQRYNIHILSLHSKYALAFSCIVLFFVGAPLGAIIRKGGLGLPMVIAILLFLTYYFLGVFVGNSAKVGKISPVLGAWIPTLVMLPLGIFLTIRATNDKGLVTFGSIIDVYVNKFKKKPKTTD